MNPAVALSQGGVELPAIEEMGAFAKRIYELKYAWKDADGNPIETWCDTAFRVVSHVMGALGYRPGDEEFDKILGLIQQRKFMPGGRYLYASGRGLHQTQNCLLLRAEDSREGWADLMQKAGMALMTGAGIGIDYTHVRPSGAVIAKTGGEASGPISLMKIINEIGRHVMQGGARRSAIWAGLNWQHPDIMEFIRCKDWSPELRDLKERDFNFPLPMELTNISVQLDDEFFKIIGNPKHDRYEEASDVYVATVQRMLKTGEPGFSIDTGKNSWETLRNACTEVTSEDDSDICNLGSINMARIESIEEMREVVNYGTLFLLAGTVYSDVPYEAVKETREKNRRLGLGLMGVHEWLAARGYRYGPCEELATWGEIYRDGSNAASAYYSYKHHLSQPVKVRAIAPTGTIGIVAETTTGIEPIFCVAYKRRNRVASANGNDQVHFEYVVDPTANRLIEQGANPYEIEDAYTLALQPERRIAFQAWLQQYVDHGISSTINLPWPITDADDVADFALMLLKWLPELRGITVYPDGARGGQPLSIVPYDVAISNPGVHVEGNEEACIGGVCGS